LNIEANILEIQMAEDIEAAMATLAGQTDALYVRLRPQSRSALNFRLLGSADFINRVNGWPMMLSNVGFRAAAHIWSSRNHA
jgi:hypothetical protein